MRTASRWLSLCLILGPCAVLVSTPTHVSAQEEPSDRVTVAMTHIPPFVENDNGRAAGFYAEIWDDVADALDYEYDIVWTESFGELLPMLETGQADVVVAPLAATAERESVYDFSTAVILSGPQLAYHDRIEASRSALASLFDVRVLNILAGALAALLISAHAIWLLERKLDDGDGDADFSRSYLAGVWDGFWWSAVTATTVGYGDKAPKSRGGRVVALIVMLSSVLFVGIFVSQVTDVLSENRAGAPFTDIESLGTRTVGTVEGSTFTAYVNSAGAKVKRYPSQQAVFEAAEAGEVDVVVANPFALAVQGRDFGVTATGPVLYAEYETFGLQQGSDLREPINMALADLQARGAVEDIVDRWVQPTTR